MIQGENPAIDAGEKYGKSPTTDASEKRGNCLTIYSGGRPGKRTGRRPGKSAKNANQRRWCKAREKQKFGLLVDPDVKWAGNVKTRAQSLWKSIKANTVSRLNNNYVDSVLPPMKKETKSSNMSSISRVGSTSVENNRFDNRQTNREKKPKQTDMDIYMHLRLLSTTRISSMNVGLSFFEMVAPLSMVLPSLSQQKPTYFKILKHLQFRLVFKRFPHNGTSSGEIMELPIESS